MLALRNKDDNNLDMSDTLCIAIKHCVHSINMFLDFDILIRLSRGWIEEYGEDGNLPGDIDIDPT